MAEVFSALLYCVSCRTQRVDSHAERVTMKNGKPAIKGKCPDCGTGMYKIGSLTPQVNGLEKYLDGIL